MKMSLKKSKFLKDRIPDIKSLVENPNILNKAIKEDIDTELRKGKQNISVIEVSTSIKGSKY